MANETTKQLIATIYPLDATDKIVTWQSSNINVATVDNNGLVTCVGVGTCIITATTSNGLSASCNVKVVSTMPDSITIEGASEITAGTSTQLTAIITPNESYINKAVTWTSSNNSAATVDANGMVQAGSNEDVVTITAKTVNRLTDTHLIEIVAEIEPTSVTITGSSHSAIVGETMQLSASVLPDDAPDKTVIWQSIDYGVATIDDNGLMTMAGYGSCQIYATAVNGVYDVYNMNVYMPVSGVTITPPSPATIYIEEPQQFTAVVNPVGKVMNSQVTWSSGDETCVTINSSGIATGIKEGTTTITATAYDGTTASVNVNILQKQQPTSITLNKNSIDLLVNDIEQLEATVLPDNAFDKSVAWLSSDPDVVTVNSDGLVTAIAHGSATITATTVNGLTSTCAITVSDISLFDYIDEISGTSIISAPTLNEDHNLEFFHSAANPMSPSDIAVLDDYVELDFYDTWEIKMEYVVHSDNAKESNHIGILSGDVSSSTPIGLTIMRARLTSVDTLSFTLNDGVEQIYAGNHFSEDREYSYAGDHTIIIRSYGNGRISITLDDFDTQEIFYLFKEEHSIRLKNIGATVYKDTYIAQSRFNYTITSLHIKQYTPPEPEGLSLLNYQELDLNPYSPTWYLLHQTEPYYSNAKVTWASSNENIAVVDEYGRVNYVADGEAIITATAVNGVTTESRVTCFSNPQFNLTDNITNRYPVRMPTVDRQGRLHITPFMKLEDFTLLNDRVGVGTQTAEIMVRYEIISKSGIYNGNSGYSDYPNIIPFGSYVDDILAFENNWYNQIKLTGGRLTNTYKNNTNIIAPYADDVIMSDGYHQVIARISKRDDTSVNVSTKWDEDSFITKYAGVLGGYYINGNMIGMSQRYGDEDRSMVYYMLPYAIIHSIDILNEHSILPTSVSLNHTTYNLPINKTLDLIPDIAPENVTYQEVKWSSSNEEVAIVNEHGTVIPITKGSVTIQCSMVVDSTKTAACIIQVVDPEVDPESVSLNITSDNMRAGTTVQLIATILPENTTNKTATWSSSDNDIATVDQNGLVTAIEMGSCTITATAVNGLTATCDIIVSGVPFNYVDELTETEIAASPNVDKNGIMHIKSDLAYEKATTLDSPLILGDDSYRLEFKISNINNELGTVIVIGNMEDSENIATKSVLFFNARYSLNSNKPYVYIKNTQNTNCIMAYSQEVPADTHEYIVTIKYISTEGDYGALYLDVNGMGEEGFVIVDEARIPNTYFTLFGRFNTDASPNMPNTYDIEYFNVTPVIIVDPTSIEFETTSIKLLLD